MDFHRAYVVSDLHLGGERGFQMFSSGVQFRALCDHIAAEVKEEPTLLLINGDFVDFLAEENASYWNPGKAVDDLQRIATDSAFQPVFEGLRTFVAQKGARLVIVLGNHDLELALPETKGKLIDLLCDGKDSRRGRIEFVFDGNGYRFQVGAVTALATHGNEVDRFNFTRFDQLNQKIREFSTVGSNDPDHEWKPSAGTTFVIDAINKIKQELPFIDLLKPEKVAMTALITLAPKYLSVAEEFAAMVASSTLNELRRPASERRFLELDPSATSSASTGVEKISQLERWGNHMMATDKAARDKVIYGGDDGTLGLTEWINNARTTVEHVANEGIDLIDGAGQWIGGKLQQGAKASHAAILRNALSPFVDEQKPQLHTLDSADTKLLDIVKRKYDVVFTGHTHARKFCDADSSNVEWFVNTGTWAGLMRILSRDLADPSEFRKLYDLLGSNNRSDLVSSKWHFNECPVAVMKRNDTGATLSLMTMSDGNLKPATDANTKVFGN